MALSGSYDYSLTARQVITFAARKCGILGITQTMSADEAAAIMVQLEVMLKSWQQRVAGAITESTTKRVTA